MFEGMGIPSTHAVSWYAVSCAMRGPDFKAAQVISRESVTLGNPVSIKDFTTAVVRYLVAGEGLRHLALVVSPEEAVAIWDKMLPTERRLIAEDWYKYLHFHEHIRTAFDVLSETSPKARDYYAWLGRSLAGA